MHKSEVQSSGAAAMTLSLALGGLLSLGIVLVILLAGAVLVSKGMLRSDAAPRITVCACLLGCFAGGIFTCRSWKGKRLLAGIGGGTICFILILAVSLLTGEGFDAGAQALCELAGCMLGGSIAGLLSARKKRRHRASHARKK